MTRPSPPGAPRVSVILPVLDGEAFLEEALSSVLKQTLPNLEIIAVDGGSGPAAVRILEATARRDPRVRILTRKHLPLAASLNVGWRAARAPYIARMDADDVSEPSRFARQVAFLDEHPQVGVVGSDFLNIDEAGHVLGRYRVPPTPATARWVLLFGACVAHPTVMLRRELLEASGGYDEAAVYSEDYELWSRLVGTTEFANITEPLVRRRVWSGAKGARDRTHNEAFNAQLMHRVASRLLGMDATLADVERLRALIGGLPARDLTEVHAAADYLNMLYRRYVSRFSPDRRDRRYIRANAARRLAVLGRCALDHSRRDALALLARAAWMDTSLLGWSNVRRALNAHIRPAASPRTAPARPDETNGV